MGSHRFSLGLQSEILRVESVPLFLSLESFLVHVEMLFLPPNHWGIFFKKLEGDGPESGWISYYRAGKKAAERQTPVQWGFSSTKVGERYKKLRVAEGFPKPWVYPQVTQVLRALGLNPQWWLGDPPWPKKPTDVFF